MTQTINPRVMSRVNKELKQLMSSPPEGVQFIPGDMDTLTEVYVEMNGPEKTPYEGGVFRMKLVLGQDYPQAPPRGFFLTKIYHPNVSANGDICVNTLKKDWNDKVTLCHILAVIRCLLIIPFPESSLNDEAGKLFMDSYDDYADRAKLMTNVHARPRGSSSTNSSSSLSSPSSKISSKNDGGQAEEVAALMGNNSANLISKDGEVSTTSKGSSVKKASSSKESKIASKQKENKKKGLKRL
mmetsp:Transcript_35755/g.42075  ORF Transcript_35755/g.42075 Transcript_35755/m.42075 type:complete len:241 (+) Transcript_35755:175-897(+)|eukprot:CAMPEP_0114375302 /NCGR_PEP_ID=MMETSP0101-20121206/36201_1 /TAXON_ID=38822 ORGANISM="Pteridomonas danica, Strain PT" /NCGR_SAMPLE_ID=MMETSP0101 /ASSEMBLY_ACC=CAM_ASM_000211 /LENGTH=240 /DNA_ID=CAMNT_0001529349 /DNA_START=73 /DNA_END=795 /DNA_ORIENTATION=-